MAESTEGTFRELHASLPRDCSICRTIILAFTTPFRDFYLVNLGPSDVVLSQKCSAHYPLLQDLDEKFHSDENSNRETFPLSKSTMTLEKEPDDTSISIMISISDTHWFCDDFELVSDGPNHLGRGYIPHTKWIAPGLAKLWKDECILEHGEKCDQPLKRYRIPAVVPIWLIDAKERRLVSGSPEMVYVTFSYVWGRTKFFTSKNAMLAQLQRPGALLELAEQLPTTVRNAIDILPVLGERYLWVDSLCIPQDDEMIMTGELSRMAAIYSNTSMAIIAADGDSAEFGLRGYKDLSQPREVDPKNRPINFGTVHRVVRPNFTQFHIPRTIDFQRAWTFQEFFFTKRRLIFEQNMIRWECSKRAHYEDTVESSTEPKKKIIDHCMDVFLVGYPSLKLYSPLIYQYNQRLLTFPEDALPAFMGIMSILGQRFEDGFLCGLPEMFFDAALTWAPWTADLTRRVSSGFSSATEALCNLLSWSWTGWAGSIDPYCLSMDEDYIRNGTDSCKIYTIPITEWYTLASPTCSNRRRVSSRFFHERDNYKDFSRPLPAGWSRHELNAEDLNARNAVKKRTGDINAVEQPPPEGCGSYFFTHNLVPNIEFWYPIPISNSNEHAVLPAQTQYIFCKTHRCFFFASTDNPAGLAFKTVWLHENDGTLSGAIYVHNKGDLEHFAEDVPKASRQVELAAISRGSAPRSLETGGPPELEHPDFPDESAIYEFFNVLWIEWIEGVAYRKASGRVWKPAWERKMPEPISLIVG